METRRTTLPARYFTDPGVFHEERERFFAGMWVYVGRAEEIAGPGDYIVREVAGESLILTRQASGALAAFYNVCRHRGTRLCTEASGRFADRIQCPYHAWTYGLDGSLLAAPHMEAAAGFDRAEHGLAPAGIDEWDGHLFVTLREDPQPLAEQLGALPEKFAAWRMGELRRAYRITYDVKANWKLLILNYSECLHCPVIHPGLQRLSHYMTGDNDPATPTWLGGSMLLREEIFTMSRDGQRRRAPLPGLSEVQQRHVYYYAVLPNLLLSLHPDYVMTHALRPVACDRTEVACEWLFHPRDHADPLFDPADAIDFWDETNREDWRVSELSQQGIGSRAYRPGPYSPREGLLWDFDQVVRRRDG
ncbi:MAG TPA: aromatic ring-hydroxylating dioxygenase subunit alpha [Gemmatimonadales bacterium]|nr:aromatic ring-hydroxylating dioxygenase subunit alpha [Gemmatimonadales bacterium]